MSTPALQGDDNPQPAARFRGRRSGEDSHPDRASWGDLSGPTGRDGRRESRDRRATPDLDDRQAATVAWISLVKQPVAALADAPSGGRRNEKSPVRLVARTGLWFDPRGEGGCVQPEAAPPVHDAGRRSRRENGSAAPVIAGAKYAMPLIAVAIRLPRILGCELVCSIVLFLPSSTDQAQQKTRPRCEATWWWLRPPFGGPAIGTRLPAPRSMGWGASSVKFPFLAVRRPSLRP